MSKKYIVMTSGYRPSTYEVAKLTDEPSELMDNINITKKGILVTKNNSTIPSLTMDVRSKYGRYPMTLQEAKERAADIASTERGVKAYICKVEFVAREQALPVVIEKIQ